MGLIDYLRRLGREPAPAPLPPGGRSSREETHSFTTGAASYLSYWDGIEPTLPPSYLDQITRIAVVNPDMSQAVANWVALGNPGHDLIITGDRHNVETAYKRLNAKARDLARHTAGIDGLINKYLEQVALTGAISSEDVVRLGSDPGVDQVVIVPAAQIRFRQEHNEYVPYQLVDRQEVRLNPVTYRYLAHMTIENSPYAKPPMIAALEPILDQRAMKKNLQYVIKKFGLFGLISAAVKPPRREMSETAGEYRQRVQEHLSGVLEAFKKNFHEGLAVYSDDIKVERTNITSDARGIQELFRLNEEQVFSGLGSDPSMHGRTYSKTESYARVVYNLLLNHAAGFQRPVKRRIERTYQLDLSLAGIPVEGISLQFRKSWSQDPLTEAKAQQVAWNVVREKVDSGLLDPDSGARELGYDSWDDAARIIGGATGPATNENSRQHRFSFDQTAQLYRHVRPRLAVTAANGSPRKDSIAIHNTEPAATTVEDWLEL